MLKILITNDDGIFAPGVAMMAEVLQHFGEVYVVCPERERSAISHSITLRNPLKLTKVDFASNVSAWAVNGTPADCIKLGMEVLLKERPDIVFSGINIGPNVGRDIHYSGTMAGASEALLYGVPAVAVSLAATAGQKADLPEIKTLFYEVAEVILRNSIPKDVFLNVNLPYLSKEMCKGVRVIGPDLSVSRYNFVGLNDPYGQVYYWLKDGYEQLENLKESSDFKLLKDGYVTISPIEMKLTQKRRLDQVSRWFTNFDRKAYETAGFSAVKE